MSIQNDIKEGEDYINFLKENPSTDDTQNEETLDRINLMEEELQYMRSQRRGY